MIDTSLSIERILKSNATKDEANDLMMMLESSKSQINASVLSTMYKQLYKFRKVDYSSIDSSKGDYNKLECKELIEKSHTLLSKHPENAKDLKVIQTSIGNLKKLRSSFVEGYSVGNDLVILLYESIVHAILDGTSIIITVTATSVVKTIHESSAKYSIKILERFNKSVENKQMQNSIIQSNEAWLQYENCLVLKEDIAAAAVGAVLGTLLVFSFIPLIRLLVIYFYNVRIRISDYLDQLVMYIKINEVEVSNNPEITSEKKKKIIKRQNKWIEKLVWLSDKIRVNQSRGQVDTENEIKKENEKITIKRVKDDVASTEPEKSPEGFDF